jgi:omega-6 fatty acid desaturase (delta-12 desaturase)
MKTVTKDGVTSVVAQNEVIIPDLTIKDLLSAIPLALPYLDPCSVLIIDHVLHRPHCFKRSALRSSLYV